MTTIPVVFFEDKMMFQLKGPVPHEEYTIPLGVADVKRAGSDITLVATSSMVHVALAAAEALQTGGVSAEVVDVRTTAPLDKETIIESAKKTSRAIVIDEGYERYGVTAEIASVIADGAFHYLDAPVKRTGRDGRARAVFAGARGPDRADGGVGGSVSEAALWQQRMNGIRLQFQQFQNVPVVPAGLRQSTIGRTIGTVGNNWKRLAKNGLPFWR